MIRCPDCDGSGETVASLNASTQAERLAAPFCPMCDGEGYLSKPSPADASAIRDALDEAYKHCSERSDFIVIVLDALDQAGATLSEQKHLHGALRKWDELAFADALHAWDRSGR